MSRVAFTAIVDRSGFSVGLAERGVAGYTPMPKFGRFPSWEAAKSKADEENRDLGLSPVEAFEIVASSMWPQPATRGTR